MRSIPLFLGPTEPFKESRSAVRLVSGGLPKRRPFCFDVTCTGCTFLSRWCSASRMIRNVSGSGKSSETSVRFFFYLSFRDKAFLIKSVICANFWYASKVALPPPATVRKMTSLLFMSFFRGEGGGGNTRQNWRYHVWPVLHSYSPQGVF